MSELKYARIQQWGMTASEWTAQNPVLRPNEFGVETDTKKFKIGDGITAWRNLAYPYYTKGETDQTIVNKLNAISSSKLDKNGLSWALDNSVLVYDKTQLWSNKVSVYDSNTKAGGFLEIGRFMVRNISGEEAQVFADSIKHLKINSDDTTITTLKFPDRSASSAETIATETSVAEQLAPLKKEIATNSIRTGNWYSAEQLTTGVPLNMGRFYICTGTGITIQNTSGGKLTATDGEILAKGGTKMLVLILPNKVSDQGDYRCKAIWAASGILGATNYTSKDFVLPTTTKKVIIKGTGGTTIWSI